jgi:hypothetical protein
MLVVEEDCPPAARVERAMSRAAPASGGTAEPPLVSPWSVLLVGIGLVAMGWLWGLALDDLAPLLRLMVLFVGLVTVGSALALHLPHAGGDRDSRLLVVGLWGLAGVMLYLARVGLGSHFDSLGLLLYVLNLVAVGVAIVAALPPRGRLLAVSVAIVLHFAAILTAVTIVPPPGGQAPFLSNHLYTRFTRHYLQLTNLNNGYHFYAPEPGPSSLLWFRVQFADGAARWVRIPDHRTVRNHLERRRLGALATAVGQTVRVPPAREEELLRLRARAGQERAIPLADLPAAMQYREPGMHVLLLLSSFVRRVVRTTEHPDGTGSPVAKVKVYRVEFMNPPVQHFQAGRDPLDPTLYNAFYQGEYDRDGNLEPSSLTVRRDEKTGQVVERVQDPFLYWLIPILRVPVSQGTQPAVGPRRREGDPGVWFSQGKVVNFVRIHAGDGDEEGVP